MKDILLDNIIPIDSIKNSKLATVREFEVNEQGTYIAYVDQKGESYDVSLQLDDSGKPISHSCDCNQKKLFCEHKEALLKYIQSKKSKPKEDLPAKLKPKTSKKLKENPLEVLINQVDPHELRKWVYTLLAKNKEIELLFNQEFGEKKQDFTSKEVRQLTYDAFKAIAKNKKKLEAGEIKKMVDLWTKIHEPILKRYYIFIEDPIAFENFHAIVDSCTLVSFQIYTKSNRISSYLRSLLVGVVESIENQVEDSIWIKSISYFIDNLYNQYRQIRYEYFHLLFEIGEDLIGERSGLLAHSLMEFYLTNTILKERINSNALPSGDRDLMVYIFKIVKNSNLFNEFKTHFKPLVYANDYNHELIKDLINEGELKKAEKYCQDLIKANFDHSYSLTYLRFLKEIYILQNDDLNLGKVLKDLFPYNFKFEDYLEVIQRMPDEAERQTFRNQTLSIARGMAYNQKQEGIQFSLKLVEHEKNYSKMIEYLDKLVDFKFILKYADEMLKTDRLKFIRTILSISSGQEHFLKLANLPSKDYFQEIKTILNKYFSFTELHAIIQKEKRGYNPNISDNFVKILLESNL